MTRSTFFLSMVVDIEVYLLRTFLRELKSAWELVGVSDLE